MAVLGFIGLGNMGSGMCANLVRAGHTVTAFDLSAAALAQAEAAGATAGTSAKDAAKGADAVITMLPAGKHVRSVYFGEDGIAADLDPGTLVIDCSTISVDDARAIASDLAGAGIAMVDAPVSGGTAAAESGALTFMVGGAPDAFAKAEPILKAIGAKIFHAGGAGNGQAAKIANNMLLGISMIATSEAFALAEKLGLDAQTFFDISSNASGQCWSMTSYCPAPGPVPAAPANRDYQPGFAVAMMLKDLNLAADAAASVGAVTPCGASAQATYAALDAEGLGDRDFSVVYRARYSSI